VTIEIWCADEHKCSSCIEKFSVSPSLFYGTMQCQTYSFCWKGRNVRPSLFSHVTLFKIVSVYRHFGTADAQYTPSA